jgi:hypothetical protein
MAIPKSRSRTDVAGRAYAGSQRQIQTYVNEYTLDLCRAVSSSLQPITLEASAIHWVSPLATDKYLEYRDEEFLRHIGAQHLAPKLRGFWPRRGPCWDALARVDGGGCILVEAKSHVPEMYSSGCGASIPSIPLIQSAIANTKAWLGVRPDADWLGRLYQSANRFAYLYFLREIGKIDAYLVNVYFMADPHSPTNQAQWNEGISAANDHLGIVNRVPYSGSVFLSAF